MKRPTTNSRTALLCFALPVSFALAFAAGVCSDAELASDLAAEVTSLRKARSELVAQLADEKARFLGATDTVKRLTEEAQDAGKSCETDKAAIRIEIEGGCLAHATDLEGKLAVCQIQVHNARFFEWKADEELRLNRILTAEVAAKCVADLGDRETNLIRRERTGGL